MVSLLACEQSPEPVNLSDDKKSQRPNIMLILADDLGYTDIGAFGSEISTPNIDKLAENGVRMTNFYAAATCSPTRSMIMSGVPSHQAGLGTMSGRLTPNQIGQPGYEGYLNHRVVSIAALLKDAGYHTYMSGKWHLGVTDDLSPDARGFEKSFALLKGAAGHFDDSPIAPNSQKLRFRENGEFVDLPEDFYSSQFYTDKIISYLKSGENDNQPFFGYLAFTAPHWPLQAPQDYIEKYKGKYDEGYNVIKEKRIQKMQNLKLVKQGVKVKPSYLPDTVDWNKLSLQTQKLKSREMEVYAAMVDNMDYQIGRLIDYLDKSGELNNTLIIFMSDNGAMQRTSPAIKPDWVAANFDNSYENMGTRTSFINYDIHWSEVSTGISRLSKAFPTEGGIKVPAIIHFPGKLENLKGGLSNEFMTVLDLAPTFLDLADTSHPGTNYKGREVIPHIGTSAASFINGTEDHIHDGNNSMVWELFNRIGVRDGNFKMVKMEKPFGTDGWELFDLTNDPGETNDIQNQNPDQLQKMIKMWQDYKINNGVILSEQ